MAESSRNDPTLPLSSRQPRGRTCNPPRVQRYALFGEIARGGMGVVFRVRDLELQRELALKVLLEEHQNNPVMQERFLEEARIAGQLQHPGVVPIHEIGRDEDGRPYFTMKLVKGQNLAQLLAERPSPGHDLPRFLGIFETICQTLAYAHSRKVIHRDLKPSNVMVGAFGEVQVMDWGLARILDNDTVLENSTAVEEKTPEGTPAPIANQSRAREEAGTQKTPSPPTLEYKPEASARGPYKPEAPAKGTYKPEAPAKGTYKPEAPARGTGSGGEESNLVLGTPHYMAPEQARQDAAALDERIDVFGLGAILCEILTGHPPFLAPLTRAALQLAVRGDLSGAWSRLKQCTADPELVDLARACLAPEPGDRPAHAAEVARRISAYRAGVEERLRRAEVEKAAARARVRAERRARHLTVALVFLLLVVGGIGGAGWWWSNERRQATEQQARLLLSQAGGLARQARDAGTTEQILARLKEARTVAQQASQLIENELVSQSLRQAIERRYRQVDTEYAQLGGDRKLLGRLVDIRIHKDDMDSDTDNEYRQAFREYGLDIDGDPIFDSAHKIFRRPRQVVQELLAALDDWYLERSSKRLAGSQRLLELAQTLDRDPWRNQFRKRLAEQDTLTFPDTLLVFERLPLGCPSPVLLVSALESVQRRQTLLDLARRADLETLPPASVQLLAAALETARDRAEAQRVLRTALRHQPGDVWLNYSLARLLSRPPVPQLDQAIRYYTAARAIRPEVGHRLAHALADKGEIDEAIAVFNDVLRLRPDNPQHHNCLGGLLLSQNQAGRAIPHFRRACQLAPRDAGFHHNLALAHLKLGQTGEAIKALSTAVDVQPNRSRSRLLLAELLFQTSRLAEAEQQLLRAQAQVAPTAAMLHMHGRIAAQQGRVEEARRLYEESLRVDPRFVPAHHDLGVLLSRSTRLQEAADHFRAAAELAPSPEAWNNLGRMERALGRHREAGESFRQALKLRPDDLHSLAGLGSSLFRQGKHAEAIPLLRQAFERAPCEPELWFDLAESLRATGRLEEAIAVVEQAISVQPDEPNCHFNLGNYLLAQERQAEAAEQFQEALALKPDFAEAACNLGHALWRQNQYHKALEFLRRGDELGRKQAGWRYPSPRWVRECERMARLNDDLPAYLKKERKAGSREDWLTLAQICRMQKRYAGEVQFLSEALSADPKWADRPGNLVRFQAAQQALRAAEGEGSDAASLVEAERIGLRRQSLDWLKEELKVLKRQVSDEKESVRRQGQETARKWQNDPVLRQAREKLRSGEEDSGWSEDERKAWEDFWEQVRTLADRNIKTDL
jgi:tetratricopeptide (TPR) repeat protein